MPERSTQHGAVIFNRRTAGIRLATPLGTATLRQDCAPIEGDPIGQRRTRRSKPFTKPPPVWDCARMNARARAEDPGKHTAPSWCELGATRRKPRGRCPGGSSHRLDVPIRQEIEERLATKKDRYRYRYRFLYHKQLSPHQYETKHRSTRNEQPKSKTIWSKECQADQGKEIPAIAHGYFAILMNTLVLLDWQQSQIPVLGL